MIKKMMGRFGIPEDQPIENKLITRSLESAQTKIEGFNFDARKHILEYDSVLNKQRQSVYTLRRSVLLGELDAVKGFINELTVEFKDVRGIVEAKIKLFGEDVFWKAASRIILQMIDLHFMEHLEAMDYLRSSVNLRAYGQRDPLVEYKKEGLRLYKEMKISLNYRVKEMLETIQVREGEGQNSMKKIVSNLKTNADVSDGQGLMGTPSMESLRSINSPSTLLRATDKIGRNDPCPCGAKKGDGTTIKYKHCGLINAPTHRA